MSRVEIESFIKSFLLFFISLASITALRYYEMYENKIYLFEERLFSQMKISSFNKEPTNFIVTNVPKSSDKISNVFSFNKNQIFVLFEMKDFNVLTSDLDKTANSSRLQIKFLQMEIMPSLSMEMFSV